MNIFFPEIYSIIFKAELTILNKSMDEKCEFQKILSQVIYICKDIQYQTTKKE